MPGGGGSTTTTSRASHATHQPPSVAGLYSLAVSYINQTDRYLGEIPAVSNTAELLGMRPIHLPIALLCLGFLFVGRLEDLILGIVGFFYPAWSSFKAIEKNDQSEAQQWLSYWVVYAAFSFIEIFGDFVLFWIPFYYILKLLFLFWLFLPQYQGATVVYQNVLRPLLQQHRHRIDNVIERVTSVGLQEPQDVADQTVRRRRP
eukprot:Blabericola_migrator_1__357@NODE_108_length_14046_cov_203_246656_g96_i0_p6_GENE_NODE_108_length_14046_cov_203_246656_g96_i0NODE_108_length_14046_cov_203_246656_g96_i0_p6_ORF_typecomplete_len203_score27_57TB2_DP1_HVA22/PF03134_19/2_6e29_NODE_108_length_14046_cov_203_246656_g96_i01325513863